MPLKCDKCWGQGVRLDHAKLGREARAKRLQRQESVKAAAQRMGISSSMLCLLEAGERAWSQELYEQAVREA